MLNNIKSTNLNRCYHLDLTGYMTTLISFTTYVSMWCVLASTWWRDLRGQATRGGGRWRNSPLLNNSISQGSMTSPNAIRRRSSIAAKWHAIIDAKCPNEWRRKESYCRIVCSEMSEIVLEFRKAWKDFSKTGTVAKRRGVRQLRNHPPWSAMNAATGPFLKISWVKI